MGNAFSELSLVIAIAVAVTTLLRLVRQPLIIGYVLTGVIVGPALLHIIKSPETVQLFADFGIALLLMIVGLGLNPRVIREIGKIAALIGVSKVVLVTAAGFGIAHLLGYDNTTAIYIGLGLSFSSTIIILKLLTDKKEQNRLYGKISVGFLLVEDLIAAVVLLGVSATVSSGLSLHTIWELTYKIVLLIAALSMVRIFFLSRFNEIIARSQEFLSLFTIGWGLGIAALFNQAGFSLEIGALIAGVTLAPLPYAQLAASKLKPLRDFFIVLFFVSLGSHLGFNHILAVIPEAIIFSLLVLIGNPILVMAVMGISGYTRKTSFKVGLAGAQVSEFALILLLLGNKNGQISEQTVSLFTLTALITIGISTYLITYSDKLYDFFEDSLRLFERRKVRVEHDKKRHYELVLLGYLKGGAEFLRVFQQLGKPYIVVDYDPTVIDNLENHGAHYIYGDVTDAELLNELNLEESRLIVSTIADQGVNRSLVQWLEKINPNAVFICSADSAKEAAELYSDGASYVMLPHYIGSEKISAFIRKSGLKKSEFKKFREKHLAYLESHPEFFGAATD